MVTRRNMVVIWDPEAASALQGGSQILVKDFELVRGYGVHSEIDAVG